MLRVKNLTKTYGDILALDNVSFDIEPGEFVFITGPSGSGKTTLLRLILRELLPDSGELMFDKVDVVNLPVKEVPSYRQKIGVVFQDFKVLPERSVRENVEVALAVIDTPTFEWEKRVNRVLELVELGNRAELFPAQLSGGELQRVSLARALVVNPKLILADEPTGNLDWDTADEMMMLLSKINDEGRTIIMATHHRGIVDKMKKREVKLVGESKKKLKVKKEEVTKNAKKAGKSSDIPGNLVSK